MERGGVGLPHGSPKDSRYKELAESIIAELPEEYADNPIAKAFAIKLFLDQNTKYTMERII